MTRLIRLASDVWVRSSEHWEANAALIAAGDQSLAVIDPGVMPAEVDELKVLAEEMVPHPHITTVFTHSDYDHMIGWQALGPQAIIAHQAACDRDPAAARAEVAAFDARFGIRREIPWDYPPRKIMFAPQSQMVSCCCGIDELRFEFHAAPGHTIDSQFVVVPERRLMFAGDYLSSLFFPMIFHSAREYLASLNVARHLVDEHRLELLVPGHGLPATSAAEIDGRLADDLAYVEALIAGASEAVAKGLTLEEAVTVRDRVHYQGRPTDAAFAGNHRQNFESAYNEASTSSR